MIHRFTALLALSLTVFAAERDAVLAVIEHRDPTPAPVVAALQAERLREVAALRAAQGEAPQAEPSAPVLAIDEAPGDRSRDLQRAERRVQELEEDLRRARQEILDTREQVRAERRASYRLRRRVSSLERLTASQQRALDKAAP